jgi:hypothetical protein
VNGIRPNVRPMEPTLEEVLSQILEKNGRIIPVGVDGTILKPKVDVEARYNGLSYRQGTIEKIHDDATATIRYSNGETVSCQHLPCIFALFM